MEHFPNSLLLFFTFLYPLIFVSCTYSCCLLLASSLGDGLQYRLRENRSPADAEAGAVLNPSAASFSPVQSVTGDQSPQSAQYKSIEMQQQSNGFKHWEIQGLTYFITYPIDQKWDFPADFSLDLPNRKHTQRLITVFESENIVSLSSEPSLHRNFVLLCMQSSLPAACRFLYQFLLRK